MWVAENKTDGLTLAHRHRDREREPKLYTRTHASKTDDHAARDTLGGERRIVYIIYIT